MEKSIFNPKKIEPLSPERIDFWLKWANENPQEVGKMLAMKEKQSEHDSLTGLLNRQGFEKHANEKISELKRTDKSYSFLFGDLDGLKKINDEEGHVAGDNYLVTVANVINESVRESDIVARWGGDEIVVLLPELNKEKAMDIAVRINSELINGYSVSFGVGEWDKIKDLETVMSEADEMVNEIKHFGLGFGERSSGVDLIELD